MGNLLSEPELLKKGRSLLRFFGKRLNDRPVPAVLLVHLLPSPSSPIGPSPPIVLQSYWLISSHRPPVLLVVLLSSACQAQAAAAHTEGELPEAEL